MKKSHSVLFSLLLILSGALANISYQEYLQGNYQIGDQVDLVLFAVQSAWVTVYCQESEKVRQFDCTTNEAPYISDYEPMQEEGDYVQSQTNQNLWYVSIHETFTVPGLDGWTHCIFKGDGYNKRRYVAKLTKIFNVESDGSLAYDHLDYVKYVEPDDVACNHILGD